MILSAGMGRPSGNRAREPDFVLFGNQQGLLVLEVKDWNIDQVDRGRLDQTLDQGTDRFSNNR